MNWKKIYGFYPYRPAAVLGVSGADAASYLQGQFTGDLRGLKPESAVYGLWLNQKGKVMADSFICVGPDAQEYLVVSYFSRSDVIRERLEAYVIADDVALEDVTGNWQGVSLIGQDSEELRSRLPVSVFCFQGRRTASGNRELLFHGSHTQEVRALLLGAGRREMTLLEMERLRLAEGIPAVPQDIGPGELPNEGGLEKSAISYTKGCYLGQEVMARLKSMGQIRRRLLRVDGDGDVPSLLPAPLFLEGRKLGELRSGVVNNSGGFAGLALLSLMHVKAGAMLSFAPDETPRVRLAAGERAHE